MSAKDTGGPAFPITGQHQDVLEIGMTLRDYFAAKAMQGLIAATPDGEIAYHIAASDAYRYADAMLEARKS